MTRSTGDALAAEEKVVEAVAVAIAEHDFGSKDHWMVSISLGTARAAIAAYLKAMEP